MVVLNFNEFCEFMAANDFKYTVGIVVYMDMMAQIAKRIRRYQRCTGIDNDVWIIERQKEQQTIQQMAIELAYTEKDNGPKFEACLRMLSGRQRRSVNQSINRMRPFLNKIGVNYDETK